MSPSPATTAALFRFLADRCAKPFPLIATLATAEPRGIARARSVIIRHIDPRARTLWLSSHVDAPKVQHLRAQPIAEVALWFPEERLQLRLLARWQIIDEPQTARAPSFHPLRLRAWQQHSETSRQLFLLPRPGRRLLADSPVLPPPLPPPQLPPRTFAVLLATIAQLDVLQIRPIHVRYRHTRRRQGPWTVTAITP